MSIGICKLILLMSIKDSLKEIRRLRRQWRANSFTAKELQRKYGLTEQQISRLTPDHQFGEERYSKPHVLYMVSIMCKEKGE